MICPNCRHSNSDSAKFCENCGYKLEGATPVESALDRLQRLVPKEFAERLLKSRRGKVEHERRIVTILFCDVKGSTALGEERDPEEILEIMQGAFDNLIEPVYRYEGTLARLMGDAILAFFGAPIAHEDDPQRAVLAALAIQDKLRAYAAELERKRGIQNFAVRIGINTGLVIVGEVGSDLRVEYTAMGEAINVASRLENSAEPGTIVIAGSTARLVKHAFELEPLGALPIRGKQEPVAAYRVVARKAIPEPERGIEGLHSPLVGRERELATLKARVRELQQGQGQIVSVMGEAGLGKSRLIAELRQAALKPDPLFADGESADLLWLEGRARSFETSIPYAPLMDLFKSHFGVRDEQSSADQYERVYAGMEARLPGQGAELAPFIASLLGVPLEGEAAERVQYLEPPMLRARIFTAVAGYFEQLAAFKPVVIVFEDLHWADATSLELIQELAPLVERAPLMLIALLRPQKQEAAWRFHERAEGNFGTRYTAILLEPLDEQSARTLVANLLEIEDLPEKVRALILNKAEGNPFFVEEVIRSLLDAKLVVRDHSHWRATREIETIAVPDTLAGVITARLDRLDEDSKRLAQTAAVIGREFPFNTLAEIYDAPPVLDESLRNLQRRELVREKSRLPLVVYLFKHALTQETAYNSMLLSRRRELHRRVAEYLEANEPERVNEIARHFLEAQDLRRALPYLVQAGDKAARAYAPPEAISYYTQALELLKTLDDLALARRAYEGLGGVLTFTNEIPRAVALYEEMLDRARARGDIPMQVSALNKLSAVIGLHLGQFPEAEQRLVEAERLAQAYDDKRGKLELNIIRCQMCTMRADFDTVVHYMGSTIELGRELELKEQLAMGLEHIASTLMWLTRFDDGLKAAQEALSLARSINDRQHEASTLAWDLPAYYLREGDLAAASRAAEEGLEIATKIGSVFDRAVAQYVLGQVAHLRGAYEQAVAYYESAVADARPLQDSMPFVLVLPLAALGSLYLDISDDFADRCADLHTEAERLLEHPGGKPGGGAAWADIGYAALRVGNLERAEQVFQLGLTEATMFKFLEKPRLLVGVGLVALARKDLEQAAERITEARAFAEERGMKNVYSLIMLADGQVSAACGEVERALEQFALAERRAAEMGMRPMMLKAQLAAAQLLEQQGRSEQAQAKREQARAVIDEMAGLFKDEMLRERFLKGAG